MRYGFAGQLVLALGVFWAASAVAGTPSHGLSLFGELKYGPDAAHFDYVNPEAPKGGTLSLPAEGTFDSLNPFLLKGVPAAGLDIWVFETLLERAYDEPDAAYGLLAESVELAADRSWVRFVLRSEACFHDGTPITAADVVFSFETLVKEGHPTFRIMFADVMGVEALGVREVRFNLGNPKNRKLALLVATELPILSKNYYATRGFAKTALESPLGSGPYRVDRVEPGRVIAFARVEDYWGGGLMVRAGRHNLDVIRFDYFRDRTIMVEALKAHEYDFHEEFTSKTWSTAYDIREVADGRMIKEILPDDTPSGVQAFFINSRREKFADPRVREALGLAFDFEWTNTNLFYGLYDRMSSYFENSELAARGLPSAAELALLEPYRGRIPDAVFYEVFVPPVSDGSGNTRANLAAALDLFVQAGWVVTDGRLVNAVSGETLSVEFLYFLRTFERVIAPYARNLERLGIDVAMRFVDVPQYQQRLEEFDFDLTTERYVQFLSPGAELESYFGSVWADEPGSRNLAGMRDAVIDELIQVVLAAPDRDSMVTATHALDRVLLWNHYMVPQWYKGEHHLIYWNKFSRPAVKPLYDLGIDCWWIDPAKEAALNAARDGVE